jgi:alkyl hydroperoxide reductase subunit AhpC
VKVAERNAVILGISADSPFSHNAFHEARKLSFPLLSDIHREAIRAYGVLDEARNVAWRSTFVVDKEGTLRWGQAGDRLMVRDGAEVLRVLDVIESSRSKK